MKNLKTLFLLVSVVSITTLTNCGDSGCPDDMIECSDGNGGTFCVPDSVGC